MTKEEICGYLSSLGMKITEDSERTYEKYTLPIVEDIGYICKFEIYPTNTNFQVWLWHMRDDGFLRPERELIAIDINFIDLSLLDRTVRPIVELIRRSETERRKKILNEI